MSETEECPHVFSVREFAQKQGVVIYSEHGEEPRGWVNAHCERCRRTYEVPRFDHRIDDDVEED